MDADVIVVGAGIIGTSVALELARTGRTPVFAFMAGVSTHTPFSPTAPFQPDWQKLMTPTPYTTEAMYEAFEHVPEKRQRDVGVGRHLATQPTKALGLIKRALAAAETGRGTSGIEGFEDVFHVFQTAL